MNQRFVVEVEAQPDGVPVANRLRQWLKLGLRGLKLRAVRVMEQQPQESNLPPGDTSPLEQPEVQQ